jgi:hypothetical protein
MKHSICVEFDLLYELQAVSNLPLPTRAENLQNPFFFFSWRQFLGFGLLIVREEPFDKAENKFLENI